MQLKMYVQYNHCPCINHSAVHAELIVTSEGPKIVEIGSRMGGVF